MSDTNQPRPRRALPPEDVARDLFPESYGLFRPARSADTPAEAPERNVDSPGDDATAVSPRVLPGEDALRTHTVDVHHDDPADALPADHERGRLRRSIALTALSTILPGAGLLGARPAAAKVVGTVVPLAFLATLAFLGWVAFSNPASLAGIVVNPAELRRLSFVLVGIGLLWVALIAATHLLTRPRRMGTSRRATGAVVVTVLSLFITAPMAVGARYSFDQQQLVENVFQPDEQITSSSRPTIDVEDEDPWEDHPRLNILLLGADGNAVRDDQWGIRTDTIMVASINTATGDLTIVQIPRNVQYTPFPEGSEMAEIFPRGFRGPGDPLEWMVNNIWHSVERGDYPGIFEGQTNRGAEALKQGVEGITGLKIDYFALLNIDGISQLINAMGGVNVNINQRLPMGTYSGRGQPSGGWLEPGANQRLNGYEGMWYARSRATTSDYDRMARQSCLVDAIIKQANPATMLTSYEAIAAASADMVMTDIPQQVLEPLVQLSFRVKDGDTSRLVFSPGLNGYEFADPDFDQMRDAVQDAIADPPEPTSSPTQTTAATTAPSQPTQTPTADTTPSTPSVTPTETSTEGSQSVTDACAFNPE